MSSSKNSVQLMGFAGSDVSLTKFDDQVQIARVSLAVNEYYKTKSGEEGKQTQ